MTITTLFFINKRGKKYVQVGSDWCFSHRISARVGAKDVALRSAGDDADLPAQDILRGHQAGYLTARRHELRFVLSTPERSRELPRGHKLKRSENARFPGEILKYLSSVS